MTDAPVKNRIHAPNAAAVVANLGQYAIMHAVRIRRTVDFQNISRAIRHRKIQLALSVGIAIQNFPEGAIISMPLQAEGEKKFRAFFHGTVSGVVEPIGALLTIAAAGIVVPMLPYLLGFAAGAMLYVVVEELIPEMSTGNHSNIGTVFFAVGFSIMMALDVSLN